MRWCWRPRSSGASFSRKLGLRTYPQLEFVALTILSTCATATSRPLDSRPSKTLATSSAERRPARTWRTPSVSSRRLEKSIYLFGSKIAGVVAACSLFERFPPVGPRCISDSLPSSSVEVCVSLTQDLGKILSGLHKVEIGGRSDLVSAIQVASVHAHSFFAPSLQSMLRSVLFLLEWLGYL